MTKGAAESKGRKRRIEIVAVDPDHEECMVQAMAVYKTVLGICNVSSNDSSDADKDNNKYVSLSVWRRKIQDDNGLLLLALDMENHNSNCNKTNTGHGAGDTNPKERNGLPVGFCFTHRRKHPECIQDCFHIWLAGVSESHRQCGIWSDMLERTTTIATERGFRYLSIATFPSRFSAMYTYLIQHGFTETDRDESTGKVRLIKSIDAEEQT